MADLMAGNNIITIKARKGNCPEITLTQTGTVTIDVMPDPAMELYVKEDTLCQGDTGIIVAPSTACLLYTSILPAGQTFR